MGPRASSVELSPVSHALLGDSERQVRQLASNHNLPWDRGLDNTVSALACCAREQGLTGINLLRVNSEGQIRYGQHDGPMLKDGTLDARQAANTPADESMARLAQLDQPTQTLLVDPAQQQEQLQATALVREPLTRAM